MKKNLVIFGGSFDPIHNGHIALIKKMFSLISIDLFFVVPSGEHPESKMFLFSSDERLLMLKSCFNKLSVEEKQIFPFILETDPLNDKIVISEKEINESNISYTWHTIEYFQNLYPQHQLHLLVGADQAQKFSYWYNVEKIIENVSLWVFPREGFLPDEQYPWNIIQDQKFEISSTFIREKFSQKDFSLNKYLPNTVARLAEFFLVEKKISK